MTVVGIGIDLVDIATFTEQLDAPGSRFAPGAFTDRERAAAGGRPERLAARWAAKESFIKAWSVSRCGRPPALGQWNPADIEVVSDAEGRPRLVLHGQIAASMAEEFGDGISIHLSLTHDGPGAAAVVVLDTAPDTDHAAPSGTTR